MFDQASAARDRFIAAGMTEKFLTDLGETLDAYDKAVEESREARIAHVGARAELEAVTEDLMEWSHCSMVSTGTVSVTTPS